MSQRESLTPCKRIRSPELILNLDDSQEKYLLLKQEFEKFEMEYCRLRVKVQDLESELLKKKDELNVQTKLVYSLQTDLKVAEGSAARGRDYTEKKVQEVNMEVSKCHSVYRKEIGVLKAKLQQSESQRRILQEQCKELTEISDGLLLVVDKEIQHEEELWINYKKTMS